MNTEKIPNDIYSTIHRLMPIVCIDVVILIDNQILLIKRNREPAKGQYWFPGGRLNKGESYREAASRIVKAETNLQIIQQRFLGVDETIFEDDPFGHGMGTHTVNIVYAARVRAMDMVALALDENHIDAQLYDLDFIYEKDKQVHPYVKKFTILAEAAYRRR